MSTPMMNQYLDIKAEHRDFIVFFRMGDFYEMFHDDAKLAAPILDIALTKRGDVPMCGIPAGAYEGYLSKLLEKGYRIAICDQLETPEEARKRGEKGPLKRGVVRIITPGTLIEDHLLTSHQNNTLVAFSPLQKDGTFGVALCDISTGLFRIETATDRLETLMRLEPKEILAPSTMIEEKDFSECDRILRITLLPLTKFDAKNGLDRLKSYLRVQTLDAFGDLSTSQIQAASALLDYIVLTHKSILPHIQPIITKSDHLILDATTKIHLEIIKTLSGNSKGSLLWAIDQTLTAFGGRLLKQRFLYPLMNKDELNYRFNQIEAFMNQTCHDVRHRLKNSPDAERALSRIAMNKSLPRDLIVMRSILIIAKSLSDYLHVQQDDLLDLLTRALEDHAVIQEGFCDALDEYRRLQNYGKQALEDLERKYQNETSIFTLKIKHNHLIGYHIDVTKSQISKVPSHFIHKQTMTGNVRYITEELLELGRKIDQASTSATLREQEIFNELYQTIFTHYDDLKKMIEDLAELDVTTSLAYLSMKQNYVRPLLTDDPVLFIEEGRHPVVEQTFSQFVPNSIDLSKKTSLILLTGPNMAGKSTYLRQTALQVFLAQIGCFIPCKKAIIGITDRIFTRIGARDDLGSGRSTFMVEMVETATILRQATKQSLVIVDEIGRGTATYDGLSIAWAVCENLHDRCRTLFATHYHEFAHIKLPHLSFFTMDIQEWNQEIVFLYKVVPGISHKSYGLHVAKLAGFPEDVLTRAETILEGLEVRKEAA